MRSVTHDSAELALARFPGQERTGEEVLRANKAPKLHGGMALALDDLHWPRSGCGDNMMSLMRNSNLSNARRISTPPPSPT